MRQNSYFLKKVLRKLYGDIFDEDEEWRECESNEGKGRTTKYTTSRHRTLM